MASGDRAAQLLNDQAPSKGIFDIVHTVEKEFCMFHTNSDGVITITMMDGTEADLVVKEGIPYYYHGKKTVIVSGTPVLVGFTPY